MGEAFDVFERRQDGLAILLLSLRAEQRHLKLAANHRERGTQFMGNVGGELAHLLERSAKAIHHAIKGGDEVVEFVAGAAGRDADAQIRAGDFLRCLRHRIHGA